MFHKDNTLTEYAPLGNQTKASLNLPADSDDESGKDDQIETLETLGSLLEPTKDKAKIKLSAPLTSVTLPTSQTKDSVFKYAGKTVCQIYMVGHFANTNKQLLECKVSDEQMMAATRLIFEFVDGKKEILKLKDKYAGQTTQKLHIYAPLVLFGGISEEAFSDYGQLPTRKDLWLTELLPYDKNERHFYNKLHPKIAKLLVERIKANPQYLVQAKNKGVCIVSLGCGDGKDMEACRVALLQAEIDCSAVGVDCNRLILEENRKRNSRDIFIEADIETIAETCDRLSYEAGEKLVVVIASGSLTRSFLNGSYSAQKILQQLNAQNIGNILIVSGWENLLITERGATSAGWSTNFSSHCFGQGYVIGDYRLIGVCERQSADEELANTLARSRSRARNPENFSILDLSLTSNPLQQCADFLEKRPDLGQQVTQMDLSWSHMSREDADSLVLLILRFPRITHITISRYESWAEQFIEKLGELINANSSVSSLKLIVRTDSTSKDEIPSLPVDLCRMLGIYETVPNKLVDLKATANSNNQTGRELKSSTSALKDVTEQGREQTNKSTPVHSNPSILMPPSSDRPTKPRIAEEEPSFDSPSFG